MPKLPSNTPRLSETLSGTRHRDYCQCCGKHNHDLESDLTMWQEHDNNDKPEHIFLMLCEHCNAPSGKRTKSTLIEAHPRLYGAVHEHAWYPGIMHLCTNCQFHHELSCTHPDQKSRGGNGLEITGPEPFVFHMARTGYFKSWYPAKFCAGRIPNPTLELKE